MTEDNTPIAFSNEVRLNVRQWIVVGLFALVLITFASPLWKWFKPFELEADYRMPHNLSNDYWLYERGLERTAPTNIAKSVPSFADPSDGSA